MTSSDLADRIRSRTGIEPPPAITVHADTADLLAIRRGDVLRVEGEEFFVLGDVMEPRFGLEDQPKAWVKRAVDLATGGTKIVKLVFLEEFTTHVGRIRMRCFRSPAKESAVLGLVEGDLRFMQGRTLRDASGANVRVIDLIPGKTLYDAIRDLAMPRAAYVATVLPGLLTGLRDAIEGIALLHAHGLCHGDIRNDHLLVEAGTGRLRWIDFDLAQAFSDFDVWSLGNVLSFVAGQGMLTFHEVRASTEIPAAVKASLTAADASAFFPYRVMNLRKVYPDLPDALGEILLHFTADTRAYYESVRPMIDDLDRALATWPGRTDG